MKRKRILITGPLGHIGSKFIHNIKPGDFEEVRLVDNLSTQRYCSLFKLPKGVPFHFIEADILEKDDKTWILPAWDPRDETFNEERRAGIRHAGAGTAKVEINGRTNVSIRQLGFLARYMGDILEE